MSSIIKHRENQLNTSDIYDRTKVFGYTSLYSESNYDDVLVWTISKLSVLIALLLTSSGYQAYLIMQLNTQRIGALSLDLL